MKILFLRSAALSAAIPAAAALFLFGAGSLHAASMNYTQTSPACNTSDVDQGPDACFGSIDGNAQQVDANADSFASVTGLFGFTDWVEVDRVGTLTRNRGRLLWTATPLGWSRCC